LVVLVEDDGTYNPYYDVITGDSAGEKRRCGCASGTVRIYPPEEESKDVEVVCEGNTKILSRESAKALWLC
jgi:hypothetical protein